MERLLRLLAIPVLLSGCLTTASEGGVPISASATSAVPSDSVTVTGEITLGWVAGAGIHTFLGDTSVGLRTSEQCPEVWFSVPAEASGITISVSKATGVGPYDVAVSTPEKIRIYPVLTGDAVIHEEEDSMEGLWSVSMIPMGVTANQRWAVAVEYSVPEPAKEIEFQLDPRCMP